MNHHRQPWLVISCACLLTVLSFPALAQAQAATGTKANAASLYENAWGAIRQGNTAPGLAQLIAVFEADPDQVTLEKTDTDIRQILKDARQYEIYQLDEIEATLPSLDSLASFEGIYAVGYYYYIRGQVARRWEEISKQPEYTRDVARCAQLVMDTSLRLMTAYPDDKRQLAVVQGFLNAAQFANPAAAAQNKETLRGLAARLPNTMTAVVINELLKQDASANGGVVATRAEEYQVICRQLLHQASDEGKTDAANARRLECINTALKGIGSFPAAPECFILGEYIFQSVRESEDKGYDAAAAGLKKLASADQTSVGRWSARFWLAMLTSNARPQTPGIPALFAEAVADERAGALDAIFSDNSLPGDTKAEVLCCSAVSVAQTGAHADAAKRYWELHDKYPHVPEMAARALFNIGQLMEVTQPGSGQSLPLFKEVIDKYPKSSYAASSYEQLVEVSAKGKSQADAARAVADIKAQYPAFAEQASSNVN